MRILFILVFVSYGFSRFSRDTSDTNLKLSVDRMEKIARITYGIYVQKGLTDGEISIDEIFKIKNLNQVFEDSGALKNELKSLVTVSQSLRKSPDIEKNQQYFLALEAIRKKVDGLGDVEKWAESGEIQKITQNLKDKEIDLPKVEKFLEYCGKLDEAFVFLTDRKNLDNAADKGFASLHFSVLKDEGTLLASEIKILNSDHPDVKTVFDIKSVKDPLSVIFQATDAAKEFDKQSGSLTTKSEAKEKNFQNFQDIFTYSKKSNKNIQGLKSVEDFMTSSGNIPNQATFEKVFEDLNDPWLKSVIESPNFSKSLENLKLFEAHSLKKIRANLKGSGGQKVPIIDLLLTIDYNPTEAETVAKEFKNCLEKIPRTAISTTDMDSLKASCQNMEKSVDGLKSILEALMEISKDPEFQQMLSDVIGFAESSVGDLQGAFDKFKSYQDYGKFNQKVLKIKSLVEKIKNLKSELKIHALAVHDNVGKVVDYQNSYKSLSEGFGCLKNVKNSGNLIGMIDLTRNMGKLSSSSLDPLEKYIEKIEKISPDLKKLQNDMNSLKGKGSDGLDLLKDRKTHSEVIQMATHGIGAMKTAIEKKAEIQKMVPELKLVDDLKKTSKSLDQKDLDNLDSLVMMEASLDEMYQGLESWKLSLKNPESTNLIDHHEIFVKAKAVSGLSLDLLEIGTSLEKLIGETTDTQKKAKLEEVLKMFDEMAFVGMEFSRYSKSFDDSKKTLTALDTFFASFAKNPSGSSGSSAFSTKNPPGSSGSSAFSTKNPPGSSGSSAFSTKNPPGSSGSSAFSTTQISAQSSDYTHLIIGIALALLFLIAIVLGYIFGYPKFKKFMEERKKRKQRRKDAIAPVSRDGVTFVPEEAPAVQPSTLPEKEAEKEPSLNPPPAELLLDKTQSDHNSKKSKKDEKETKVGSKKDAPAEKTQDGEARCKINVSRDLISWLCDTIFEKLRKTKEVKIKEASKKEKAIGEKTKIVGNVYTFYWEFVSLCFAYLYMNNTSESFFGGNTDGRTKYEIEPRTQFEIKYWVQKPNGKRRKWVQKTQQMDANTVTFPNKLQFILGKSPTTEEEAYWFWVMIKESKTKEVFMMSGFEEDGKNMCYEYIPLEKGHIKTFKKDNQVYTIECKEYKEVGGGQVVRRQLEVTYEKDSPKLIIEHVQYIKAKDLKSLSESPMNPAIVAKLVRMARINKEPVIVHCQDGVNRSGAFAYIEWLIQRFGNKPNKDIDFVQELFSLRAMKKHAVSNDILFGFSIIAFLAFLYGDATCELIEKLKIEYHLRFNWKRDNDFKDETQDEIMQMDQKWIADKEDLDYERQEQQKRLEKLQKLKKENKKNVPIF
ncbi:hypothetical protein L3Y34_000565 [Caenorhabditis briggsae]|uniref:Tyrosine-protein phosphatase domain-containing protein n=1 Tax=Caenorhabditis briggsae TaxID=6238 RepID=A0AAE9IMD6_CAEBR|nr:hypothetical protein L3Y34_000565 [Caenorhabditis briggsae]